MPNAVQSLCPAGHGPRDPGFCYYGAGRSPAGIQRDLGLDRAQLTFLSAVYGLAFGGLLLLGGRLADRLGRRRALEVGLGLFGMGALVGMTAPGFALLLAARFLQGVGAAVASPAAMALVGSVFTDERRRTQAMALWGTLSAFGAVAGILLSGFIASWLSWRWVFVLPLIAALAGVGLAARLLPPGPAPASRPLDVPGAILVTAGTGLLSYGLMKTLTDSWTSRSVLALLAGGGILLSAFLLVESRVASPLLPPSFFKNRHRTSALLVVLLVAAGHSTASFLLSLYWQQIRGYSPLATSLAFLPFVLLIVTGPLAARLLPRMGAPAISAAGMAAAGSGLFLAGQLGSGTAYGGLLLVGLLLIPLGTGLAFAGATVAATDDVPEEQRGLTAAVVNMAMEVGPTVGLALLVSLAGSYTSRLIAAGLDLLEATAAGYGFALQAGGLVFLVVASVAGVLLRRPVPPVRQSLPYGEGNEKEVQG